MIPARISLRLNRRWAITLVIVAALLPVAIALGVGELLSRPARRPVGNPPEDLAAQAVSIFAPRDTTVSGWFSPGIPGRGAVLLLHGVRTDRRSMLGRARLLHQLGYAVLSIDLPAHGESTGDRITFGVRESEGVRAALEFLRRQVPNERIGVVGVSLGAAALVLGRPSPPPDAVVLESMFPTLREAVSARLEQRLGALGPPVTPLLLLQVPFRLGIREEQARPIDAIASLGCPVLIAHGTADQHTPLAQAQRIVATAQEPKEFWAVDGAAHVDLLGYAPQTYAQRVLPFLERHLRR